MGKSRRELNKALKECYADEVQDNNDDYDIGTEEDNIKEEEEKIQTVTMNIKTELTNYIQDNGLPLCEYLDYDNINQYIRYILKK
tara:strand:+ start:699 stop:953 length:255 start_codon:yes stop_codon:yes gene_type:complete